MIAHHEFVAGEGIEGVLELRRLRHREIAGVRHPMNCRWSNPCPVDLLKNAKDCVRTKAGRREQPVVHTDYGRSRVLLHPEHGASSTLGRRAVFDRLGSEQDIVCSPGPR